MSFSKETSMAAESQLPKGAWLVVALLFFVGALNYLDRMMIATMRSSILEAMPMTEAQFGLLTSVFLWVYGLLSPVAGFLADRFNRSKVIIGSLFVWSFVTWLTAHATTFEELLVTRALMGISEACYIPAALALIVDYHKGSTRSLATGIHMTGIVIGQSLGFMGGWMAERHDWSFVFSIFGIIGIVYSLILLVTLRDAPSSKTDDSSTQGEEKIRFFDVIRDLFKSWPFVLLMVFWGLIGIVGWMVMGWLPTYYKEQFNLSQGIAGFYATSYLYPAAIIGLILGGFWADRWSRTNSYARILVPVIGLILAAPCIYAASFTTVLPIAIVFFMLYALTRNFTDANLMPVVCMVADPRYRATGYGLLNMFGSIVGGIGLYLAGVLRDRQIDLGKIYQYAAWTIVLCVVILLLIRWLIKNTSKIQVKTN